MLSSDQLNPSSVQVDQTKLMVNSSMDFRRAEGEEDPYQKHLGNIRNRPLTGRIGFRP